MNTRLRRGAAGAALVLAAGAVTGCASSSARPAPQVTQMVQGYDLEPSHASALDYPGNDSIFTARVIRAGESLVSQPIRSEAPDTYVYTPVSAVVTEVLKPGERQLRTRDKVVLRVLGGHTGNRVTINGLSAGPSEYRPGTQVQVFASSPYTDPETKGVQYVPNWAFGFTGDTIYNLHEPQTKMTATAAQLQTQEVAAWRGWQSQSGTTP